MDNKEFLKQLGENSCNTLQEFLNFRYQSIIGNYYHELNGVKFWNMPLNSFSIFDGANNQFINFLQNKSKTEIAQIAQAISVSERMYNNFLNEMFVQLGVLSNELKPFENLFDLNQITLMVVYTELESTMQFTVQLCIDWGSNYDYDYNSLLSVIAEKLQNTELMQPMQSIVRELKNTIIKIWKLDNDMIEKNNYNSDSYCQMIRIDGDNIIDGYFITWSEY